MDCTAVVTLAALFATAGAVRNRRNIDRASGRWPYGATAEIPFTLAVFPPRPGDAPKVVT